MDGLTLVDGLYEELVRSLTPDEAKDASRLAFTLGLAPSEEVPWSRVFGHEVTLAAPALAAEAMNTIDERTVREAVRVHMLAVIEAFATDRIEDGQAARTPALVGLVHRLRAARDQAMDRLCEGWGDPDLSFAVAERDVHEAIAEERAILTSGRGVSLARYLDVSLRKQHVGLPGSLALARRAGWDARRRRALRGALEGVWLGLQAYDDVADVRDDLARGGAWAAAIARGLTGDDRDDAPVMALIERSSTLPAMLVIAARELRAARRLAAALGAERLSAWARAREDHVADLAEHEQRAPGYTDRARALTSWAKVVLA